MSITIRTPYFITSLYLTFLSKNGIISCWLNRHYAWKYGFVVRIFWLGFVLRWSKYDYYIPHYIPFLDEEPH